MKFHENLETFIKKPETFKTYSQKFNCRIFRAQNQNGCVYQKNIIQWNEYNPQKDYVKEIADKTIDNFKKLKKNGEERLKATAVITPLLRYI